MTQIPDYLPALASGQHDAGSGQACVMEYVSVLAGEEWSDHPKCTDPVLAAAARSVNDWMTDEGRHLIVPLIGRLFGTAERGSDEVGVKIAQFVNDYVHAQIKTPSTDNADERLAAYLNAIINKFDELTGFNYETEGRKLSEPEFRALSDAVLARAGS